MLMMSVSTLAFGQTKRKKDYSSYLDREPGFLKKDSVLTDIINIHNNNLLVIKSFFYTNIFVYIIKAISLHLYLQHEIIY